MRHHNIGANPLRKFLTHLLQEEPSVLVALHRKDNLEAKMSGSSPQRFESDEHVTISKPHPGLSSSLVLRQHDLTFSIALFTATSLLLTLPSILEGKDTST